MCLYLRFAATGYHSPRCLWLASNGLFAKQLTTLYNLPYIATLKQLVPDMHLAPFKTIILLLVTLVGLNNRVACKPVELIDSTNLLAITNLPPGIDVDTYLNSAQKDGLQWFLAKNLKDDQLKGHTDLFLKMRLPTTRFAYPALFVKCYNNGYQLFVDGHRVFSSGKFGEDSLFRYDNLKLIPLDTSYRGKTLIMYIHYQKLLQVGYIESLTIGSVDDLTRSFAHTFYKRLRLKVHESIAAIFQMAIGILALLVFFIRFGKKEFVFLFFAVFAIASGFSNCTDFIRLFINVPMATYVFFDILSSFLIPVGFLGVVKIMAHAGRRSVINYAIWVSLVAALIAPLFPISIPWDIVFWGSLMVYIAIAFYTMIKTKAIRQKSFRLPIIGFVLITMATIHDFFLLHGFPSLPFGLYNWAMLFLIFSFGYYIEAQYRSTADKLVNYTLELEKTRSHLITLEKENLLTQYEVLKNQVNPHFLFNSLNALSALIRSRSDLAVRFVEEFSDLYRYVLDVHNRFVVEISHELTFLNSYAYLQKIRYGNNLTININIGDDQLANLIMPLTLQILVENAIKHNEISEKFPLTVDICTEGNYIVVVNNLQTIEVSYSKGIGLRNLTERYAGLTDVVPEFYTQNGKYIARVPIIKAEE